MEFDPALYDAATACIAAAITAASPLTRPEHIWAMSEDATRRLVEEELLPTPRECEWRNAPKTIGCENLAPITKTLCAEHGN